MRGKDQTLILYDENDEEVDNLGIDKWTTDTVDEYLNQILTKFFFWNLQIFQKKNLVRTHVFLLLFNLNCF